MFGFKDEASYICLNLSTYVKSGMPIGRSLDLIKNTVKDKKYKESLKRIEKKVLNGEALSKAFKEEGNLYPDLMKDMMKIGEESGNLEEVLEKCARNILAEKEIKNKIIKSLRYPISLLIGLIIMIFGYVTYILPQFVDMYELGGIEGSKIMTLLNNYINFVEENPNVEVIVFCYFSCVLISLYLFFKVIPSEKILEKIEVYRMYYEIRILFLISMILNSGISLNNSLSVFGESLSDVKLRKYIKSINEELIKKIKSRNDKDVNYTKEGKIMRVNTNVSALVANNQMGRNVNAQSKSMEKLSSGVRIKRAADDAAGLAISEKMRAQIKGLDQAGRNVQDGISVVQTAEGALEETGNILQRMRTLSLQSSNETNTAEERQKVADELLQLKDEVERISSSIEFNGKKLLDGSSTEIRLQVGANFGTNVAGTTNNNNEIKVALVNTSSIMSKAGITSSTIASLNVDGASGTDAAKQMVSSLDMALKELNTSRAKLGAQQNRLESTQNNLNNTIENVTAAESRIRDTDVASEMVNLSKMNILVQASQSMLAQANQQPQGVLQLLG